MFVVLNGVSQLSWSTAPISTLSPTEIQATPLLAVKSASVDLVVICADMIAHPGDPAQPSALSP